MASKKRRLSNTAFALRLIAGTLLAVIVLWILSVCFPGDGDRVPVAQGTPTPTSTPVVTPTPIPQGTVITISAKGYRFDPDEFTVRRGSEVRVRFINQDRDVSHNVTFYKNVRSRDELAMGARGGICKGPCENEVRFVASVRAGIYEFICDVHPGMRGKIYVAP